MPATADNLRDLHSLHQRARALRDLMISGPKTLAARQSLLSSRLAALELSRKALQDERMQVKKREHSLQSEQAKINDLKVKLNLARKNDEYKAIQNQIAHEENNVRKLEEEILESMMRVDERTSEATVLETEVKKTGAEVTGLESRIQSQAADLESQLRELEQAIIEAEDIIPIDQREQYRRNVKQRGPEAFAAVDIENKACAGCFVSVTHQMINELINCKSLNFCKTCGRILYLAEDDFVATQRKAR